MRIAAVTRRRFLRDSALVVGVTWLPLGVAQTPAADAGPRAPDGRTLKLDAVDAFLALKRDGGVIVYTGKVDLGTGHRIAMRQMVAEELDLGVDRIELIEGDTALTPDQGPTAGSTGVMRGGVQLRQAAATARQAVIARAAGKLARAPDTLRLANGVVYSVDGQTTVRVADLYAGEPFGVAMDPKAPLKKPADYRIVGRSLPRPDLPDKLNGTHTFVQDIRLPEMLHGRALRPAAVGAKPVEVDDKSIAHLKGARVIRLQDFIAVVAEDEWTAVRAARELKVRWSQGSALVGSDGVRESMKRGPFVRDDVLKSVGDTAPLAAAAGALRATYYWPVQSHASMGPSCAVADVRADTATVWTASQATHRYQGAYARMFGLPKEKVRLIYVDGAGCYGMNGHDDAAADAVLLSKATGQPVRVQWSREDELGWDPKGPPQLLELRAALDDGGRIAHWEAEMWVPMATANLAHVPLLAPREAGLPQPDGQAVGLISQNADPPYRAANVKVLAHWIKDAPLRPSNIRAPGKVANSFAVESFVDELCAFAKLDPLAFRLRELADARGREVIQRCTDLIGWANRKRSAPEDDVQRGTGLAYVHYKHNETYVAIAMQVEATRSTGDLRVKRIACAHDCGLMINPDAVRNQVEGNILQTLSRTLYEETLFDKERVTNVTWASYRLLRFAEVPELMIDLVSRPELPPLGAGEAASTPVPAALANAIADATGVRLREVPFSAARLKAAWSKTA
jgi:nicotinate dehydrogenase subunit B